MIFLIINDIYLRLRFMLDNRSWLSLLMISCLDMCNRTMFVSHGTHTHTTLICIYMYIIGWTVLHDIDPPSVQKLSEAGWLPGVCCHTSGCVLPHFRVRAATLPGACCHGPGWVLPRLCVSSLVCSHVCCHVFLSSSLCWCHAYTVY